MFTNIKQDIPSGLVVFLVALPLCLGVALASGAPLLSGVISGVIGGIIVGILSHSNTSVSGPAAGLVTLVLAAIASLGDYSTFLLAVFLAGLIQIFIGFLKGGFIANYIPSNVIQGLLASIGIILILKQIPHAVGFDVDPEEDFIFFQKDGENTFSELFNIMKYFSWGAVIIAFSSLALMIGYDKTKWKPLKYLPSPVIVILLGVLLNKIFQILYPGLYLSEKHLVTIPNIKNWESVFFFPNFSAITETKVWYFAFTIAAFATLETLLNLDAVERIDPHKRLASPNRELVAQGVGNSLSGLIGGLPITSVIVRSSVNIYAGAQSKFSTIFHGILLSISVVFFESFLNLIPLSSLAVILIVTGFKLTNLNLYQSIYKKGFYQFLPFIATIIAIIFTDLLTGVLIGLSISFIFILKNNYKNPFLVETETLNIGETVRIELPNQVSFLNKASIKDTLWALPENSKLIVDASNCNFIDHDILEVLEEFKSVVSVEKKIQLNLIGLKDSYELSDQVQFVNILDKEAQQKLTPDEILDFLKRGNERFVKGKWSEKYFKHQVNATAFGQNPIAVVLSCIDSRTSPEIIFDAGLGDIISIRIAGNIVNEEILGSLELSCDKIGTKLIVVLGHSNCGAVSSALYSLREGNIASITNKIQKAIDESEKIIHPIQKQNEHIFNHVVKANVKNSITEILTNSSYLSEKVNTKEIKIVSGFYDTSSGEVQFFENIESQP
ncbi:carbonic anhydrase [Leptospira montravelensis]|uniref:Carbonic anhydrase n=1 Tax=Leptospira montravelensis TaxID=2484961 RepID=A0ABY2LVM2_9LEPT|nr:SulP family inorganic anion transporter [Leptospira montravelensis]TGK83762.1 carbonic anhydrase [Leptospira montravelensis]TGL05766.1 carbonic anhydrase [Leptospira montravelensis]